MKVGIARFVFFVTFLDLGLGLGVHFFIALFEIPFYLLVYVDYLEMREREREK